MSRGVDTDRGDGPVIRTPAQRAAHRQVLSIGAGDRRSLEANPEDTDEDSDESSGLQCTDVRIHAASRSVTFASNAPLTIDARIAGCRNVRGSP